MIACTTMMLSVEKKAGTRSAYHVRRVVGENTNNGARRKYQQRRKRFTT